MPSCQDVDHTCPNCIFLLKINLILGGFLMAKFRRGVDKAKLYPVTDGYMPIPQAPQQSGIVGGSPKN
jgi:hypothetical protein